MSPSKDYEIQKQFACGGCGMPLGCEDSRWLISGKLFLAFMCPKCKNDDGIGIVMSDKQILKMLRVIPDRLKKDGGR